MTHLIFVVLLAQSSPGQKPPSQVPTAPKNVELKTPPKGQTLGATNLDCDAATPPPVTLTSGQPYNVAFCVPSVVSTPSGDVPNRVAGYRVKLDVNPPSDLQLPLGPPSPVLKLQPTYFTAPSGVAKGNHQWSIIAYNFPLDPNTGQPDNTKPAQLSPEVLIPFVAADALLPGAPPAVQKGQVVRQ